MYNGLYLGKMRGAVARLVEGRLVMKGLLVRDSAEALCRTIEQDTLSSA